MSLTKSGGALMPTITGRPVTNAVSKAIELPAPISPEERRVSSRTAKGQPPYCFSHSGFVAFVIASLILLIVKMGKSRLYFRETNRLRRTRVY